MRVFMILCFASSFILACKDPFSSEKEQFYLISSENVIWISPSTSLPNQTAGYFKLNCVTRQQERYKSIGLYQADSTRVGQVNVRPFKPLPVAYTGETNETDWWLQPITTSCNNQVAFWINMHRGFASESRIASSYRVYNNSSEESLIAYVMMAENYHNFVIIRSAKTHDVVASAVRTLAPVPIWNVSNTGGLSAMIPAFLLMMKDSENFNCPTRPPPPPADEPSISAGAWVGIGVGIAAAVGVMAGFVYRAFKKKHPDLDDNGYLRIN